MIIVELGGIQKEYIINRGERLDGFKHFLRVWIFYTMCDMLWPGSDGLVSLSDVTFLTTCSSGILFLNRLIPLGLFLEYLYQFIYSNVSVWCVNFCSPRPDQVTGEWHDWLSRHLSPNYPGSPSRWCIVTLVTAWQSSHSLYLILTSIHRVIRARRAPDRTRRPSHAVLKQHSLPRNI